MQMKTCLSNLGKGQVEPGYLFYGEEEYLKEQALGQLRRLTLSPGMEMMDEQAVEGQGMSLADYQRLVDTPPFMSPRRLVVVRDDPRFGAGAKPSKEDKAAMQSLAEHLNDTATLVLYVRGALPASHGWLKLMDGPLAAVNFAPLTAREAAPWIRRMAKQAGLELAAGTAEFLFEYVGGLLKPVESEMGKLAAYCQGEPADRAAVKAICVQAVEHKVFAMVDDLMTGRGDRALAAYRALVQDGESPTQLLALLAIQLRVWERAGEVARLGMSSADAAKALGTKAFVVDKALRRGPSAGPQWNEALTWCADADAALKTGAMSEEACVEYFVMRLVQQTAR